jgi:RNA polymerase sigma factor (sigma-70 family)
MTSHRSIAVVGGGLAGLAAATELARQGRQVRLFESAETLGGRAQTEERDGYSFNLGPHALYVKGEAARLFRELGIDLGGHLPSSSGLFASVGGALHGLPATPSSLFRTSLFTLREKLQTARLLARLPKLDLAPWRGRPVAEWIASAPVADRVRLLLGGLVRVATYANAPDELDAAVAIHQIQLALAANVYYLDSGWRRLVEGLERRAREAGVAITTRANVERLELRGRAVDGVVLADGSRVEVSDVVVAGDPQTAARLAGADRAPELQRAIASLVPVRAACLDLALKRLPRPDRNFALGLDRPMYLSVHSATAALAPPGGALVHVARYLAPGEPAGRDAMRASLEAYVDEVQPGWRSVVAHQRLMPAMTVSHGLPSHRGPRPGPHVAEIPGLWLAGDWVGERGLLADAAVASAEEVVRAIGAKEESQGSVSATTDYAELYREQGDFLRGYCYRLTGSVADASDLVQETFVRAIESPPRDPTASWRPWLVRVATNLLRDRLRRDRREYVGSWLPAPIDTAAEGWWRGGLDGDAAGRYEAAESVTFAFLLALETLTPIQRAVLLLRDVYDYSTRECADALELSEPNVKTTLHRARRTLHEYDHHRRPPSPRVNAETAGALERLLACFATRDARAMEALLASDVEAWSDGGGQFYAARKPVRGRETVALFFSNIAREGDLAPARFTPIEWNGLPGILVERDGLPERFAPLFTFAIELDEDGLIRRTYSVLNPAKLQGFARPAAPD